VSFRTKGIFCLVISLLVLPSCALSDLDQTPAPSSPTANQEAGSGDAGAACRALATSPAPEAAGSASDAGALGATEGSSTDGFPADSPSEKAEPPLPSTPGVVLRLEATTGLSLSGDRVSRWSDQSGHSHDATQGDAKYQPTLSRARNGLPAVHFTGKVNPQDHSGDGGPFLSVKDAADFNFGTDDWAIAVVAGYDNPLDGTHNGALGAFFGKEATPEIFFCGNWTFTETTERANLHVGFGESLPGLESTRKDLNDGNVRVYLARRTQDKFELRVNGQSSGQGGGLSGTSLSSPGVDIGIGSFSGHSATRSLRGDVLAMWVLRGALSMTQLDELEGYLAARYAVGL